MNATILGVTYQYPTDYGLYNCSTHDVLLPPSCATTKANGDFDPLNNPFWCAESWCYVDPDNCNVDYDESAYFAESNMTFSCAPF